MWRGVGIQHLTHDEVGVASIRIREDRNRLQEAAADHAGDRAGHVAVIERWHEVHYTEDGNIQRAVFDGWEATDIFNKDHPGIN